MALLYKASIRDLRFCRKKCIYTAPAPASGWENPCKIGVKSQFAYKQVFRNKLSETGIDLLMQSGMIGLRSHRKQTAGGEKTMTIAELAAKYEQYVIDMRREFHENPELRTMRSALSAASGRSWTS